MTIPTEVVDGNTVLYSGDNIFSGYGNLTFNPTLSNGDLIRIKGVDRNTSTSVDYSFDFSGTIYSTVECTIV